MTENWNYCDYLVNIECISPLCLRTLDDEGFADEYKKEECNKTVICGVCDTTGLYE